MKNVRIGAVRQTIVGAIAILSIATVVAACGSDDTSSTTSGTSAGASSAGKKYDIVLSNHFMGNEWRPQMVNDVKTVAKNKFADKVNLDVKISDVSPAAQIASLQGIIRDKPDAIILDAASGTALNPTIEQACKQGIKVISFDQTATAPCNNQIIFDVDAEAIDMFNWMATILKGKGNIAVDQGLAGTPRAAQTIGQWQKLAKQYPAIKIVAQYASSYSDGPEQQGVASVASQHPEIDGVISNYSCAAVLAGLKKAGHKPVPCASDGSNRTVLACLAAKVPCFFYGGPAFIGAEALSQAVSSLDSGKPLPKLQTFFNKNYVTSDGNVKFDSKQPYEVIKEGVNYLPDESPALFTPVTYSDWNITPADALGK